MTAPMMVVTGGSSGIGAAIVAAFSQRGWNVSSLDVTGRPAAGSVTPYVCDVTSTEALARCAATVGPVDLLVVNAGLALPDAPFVDIDDQQLDRLVSVNLVGAIKTARAFVPSLTAGGSIVFIASTAGLVAHPMAAVYASTKAGMIGLMRSLAAELAPAVRVNAVTPGGVDTPLVRRIYGDEAIDQLAADPGASPLGRVAQPSDVAHAVVYLAEAQHVTGSILRVDGGSALAGTL